MKKRIYFIDFENIGSLKQLHGVQSLSHCDEVYILYTDTVKNRFAYIGQLCVYTKASITMVHVGCGQKNALDFQLAAMAGRISAQMPEKTKIYIVSKDKGYDCLEQYFERFGVKVLRIQELTGRESKNAGVEMGTDFSAKDPPPKKLALMPWSDAGGEGDADSTARDPQPKKRMLLMEDAYGETGSDSTPKDCHPKKLMPLEPDTKGKEKSGGKENKKKKKQKKKEKKKKAKKKGKDPSCCTSLNKLAETVAAVTAGMEIENAQAVADAIIRGRKAPNKLQGTNNELMKLYHKGKTVKSVYAKIKCLI